MNRAIVSGHIWLDEKGHEDIEILSQVDDDEKGTEIFDDIDHALLDEIEIGGSKDYYFIAIVRSRFTKEFDGENYQYDVEHEVIEIKDIKDLEEATHEDN